MNFEIGTSKEMEQNYEIQLVEGEPLHFVLDLPMSGRELTGDGTGASIIACRTGNTLVYLGGTKTSLKGTRKDDAAWINFDKADFPMFDLGTSRDLNEQENKTKFRAKLKFQGAVYIEPENRPKRR